MGLPGAGKTTLAADVSARLFFNKVVWLNADVVRERFDDWDFTLEGRLRQAYRMRKLADEEMAKDRQFVVIDMVAPLKEMRDLIAPDMLVWVDTIDKGRYDDTNQMFESPEYYDLHVITQDADKWAATIANKLLMNYQQHQESQSRSIIKTVTWRLIGSGATFLISWLITGNVVVAGAILGIHFFTNTLLYYIHERVWNKINWGKHDR